MLTLEARPESIAALRDVFARIEAAIVGVAEEAPVYGVLAYRAVVEEIFRTEGSSIGESWAPLAEYTQAEREHFEYGATHPILRREGFLRRSLTDPTMGPQRIFVWEWEPDRQVMHQGGNVEEIEASPGQMHYRFGTLDDRFSGLYGGGRAQRSITDMLVEFLTGEPESSGRPMVPGDAHAELVGKPLDAFLVAAVEEKLGHA
jgi:hypothetical protein